MVAFVSVLAAALSGFCALTTFYLTRRAAVRDRLWVADETAMSFRMPLLAAASDLQTRLFNIRKQDFLTKFSEGNSRRAQQEYEVVNTLFLVGQYLCYAEVIRRGNLYLDPVDNRRQKNLVEHIEAIRDTFASSSIDEPTLCLFRGEQRAVGEVMLTQTDGIPGKMGQWDCMGYAAFVEMLKDREKARWFDYLKEDLAELARDVAGHDGRLVQLQNCLVDLVDLIDPKCEHVTARLRQKL
jgi:hypothetical protein